MTCFFLKFQINELLTWITIVGCTLSIISLLMCLYVFTFVRGINSLKNLRNFIENISILLYFFKACVESERRFIGIFV